MSTKNNHPDSPVVETTVVKAGDSQNTEIQKQRIRKQTALIKIILRKTSLKKMIQKRRAPLKKAQKTAKLLTLLKMIVRLKMPIKRLTQLVKKQPLQPLKNRAKLA